MEPPLASALAEAHIEAQARLRRLTGGAVTAIWRDLPAYDRANVDQWLSQVVPLVRTAQRGAASLTEAFLANARGRRPLGINPAEVTGARARRGIPPAAVYHRPFVTLWSKLGDGVQFDDALNAGLARATATAAMDVQLAMRETANAVERADDGIYGFERVADGGACAFCLEVDGAYVKSADAMPLHNNCGCGLEPLTEPHSLAVELPSGVAVHEHGELGPVLVDPAHDFTPESAL